MRPHRVPQGDLEAIACVAAFLVNCEDNFPGTMYGSWTVTEALEAMAHLVGCSTDQLRQIGAKR